MLETKDDCRGYWHNQRTGETDYREMPATDADALDYLPQHPAAKGLYLCRRELGDTIAEAMTAVLEAVVKARQ